MDEAASLLRMTFDSKPEELDRIDRQIIQLKIEQAALKKEGPDRKAKGLMPSVRNCQPRRPVRRADKPVAGGKNPAA